MPIMTGNYVSVIGSAAKQSVAKQETNLMLIHAYIICFFMVAWNTQIFIFGWCDICLMGISFVICNF